MPLDAPILVVDDDPSILGTVSEILTFERYSVETATNGAEALAILDRATPWLILLDMRMPVLDGWGFMRAVRARGITTPILVMTAAHDGQRWANEVQAADFLSKPFEMDELLAAVELQRTKGAD
jgi:DNA-binding response OmpR family regulator